jgi:hypothetical protein
MPKYATRYARLVANTAEPESEQGCWLWTGYIGNRGYPEFTERVAGQPRSRSPHRAMLEEVLNAEFPFDEGGHLCYVRRCIHPDHLEVQTPAHNLSDRRGYGEVEGCMIPTIFPRVDALQAAADRAWDTPGELADACPF